MWRAPSTLILSGIFCGGCGIIIIIVFATLFMERGEELVQNRVLCYARFKAWLWSLYEQNNQNMHNHPNYQFHK